MSSPELIQRATNDLAASRSMLSMIQDGDDIVGSTVKSLALRTELAQRIATLERLLKS